MNTLLANQSAVTVVFFDAKFEQDLPKKKDIKSIFKVRDGTYYKRYGTHRSDCTMLLDAIALYRAEDDEFRLSWSSGLACSHILLLQADTYYNSWISLRFDAKHIGGFNLEGECLTELKSLFDKFRTGSNVRDSAKYWRSRALAHIETATEQGIIDESITKIDLPALELLAATYGLKNLRSISDQISSWVQRYSWDRNLLDESDTSNICSKLEAPIS